MSSEPTTIADPSQNSGNQKSDHDIIIALTVLFGTGVVCIACACYVNIRRRNRALKECTHLNSQTHPGDVEAQRTNVDMTERSTHERSRRYFNGWQRGDGGTSQTALTGPAAQSSRSGSALDRRCSMNSSMMSDYGRSPAGSTFDAQTHGMRDTEDPNDENSELPIVEPPPRYEMAVREPPAVHLDTSPTASGNVTPTVATVAGQIPAAVVRNNDDDEDLYRSPTPPVESRRRSRER